MKVLMVITVELGKNGIATCVLNYCEVLNKIGVQTDVAASGQVETEIRNRIKKYGAKLYRLPSRKKNPLSYWRALCSVIKEYKYDIVHVHGNSSTMSFELSAALAAGCRVRIPHSHNTTCGHLRVHRLLLPLFDRLYTNAAACGNAAGKWLYGDRKFQVIPNGVHLDKYRYNEEEGRKYRKAKGVGADEILIGHIGLFNYQKNHEFLIHVFAGLLKQRQEYRLLLAGDGPLRREIEEMTEALSIRDKVIFAGNESDIPACLSAMDLFVLPSRFEGLPYVLIEAQAAALPCLAASAVTEEADVTGLIRFISGYRVSDWVDGIAACRKGHAAEQYPDIREKLIRSHYDIEHNGELLKHYYEECVKTAGTGG